jgi:hypothetical protein
LGRVFFVSVNQVLVRLWARLRGGMSVTFFPSRIAGGDTWGHQV